MEGPQIVPPPPDILPVIDKMASYVAKNGPAFEFVVKNKADGRFDFVHSWHQHNPYYEYKKRVYSEVSDRLNYSVADPGFPEGGAPTPMERAPAYYFANCLPKTA